MSKKIMRKKKMTLDPHKIDLPAGVKLTNPLEITVSLVREIGGLYDVCFTGGPLLRNRRLISLSGLEKTEEAYEEILRKIKCGDYTLQSIFEVKFTPNY